MLSDSIIEDADKQKNMNIEDFRNICLSMKGVIEKLPFSEARYAGLVVYYIGDKWFAVSDTDDGEYCNLKCDPDYSLELQDRYNGIVPGWHMNKRHWISVYYNSDVPNEIFKQLIENSYNLVYKSLTMKKRIEIENS